ncbi:MAG: hypothetical protein LKF82_06995 [Acinetobacter populi]|jgi:hypothetical protein|uniref:hypothetical protein n=1 Tax=Acinetobacter populi TaxID=1582270 RepID=UPI00235633A8|nr:hypothetical protein [Acinetobacter populi]MCH4247571.1 hypothetical protein [Acinetobacter populi]
MYEDFKYRFSCSLQAVDIDGNKIEIQFFSQYRPEESEQKILDIWTYDLIRFDNYDRPIRFKWGNTSITHPLSNKVYTVIYGEHQ